MKLLKLFYLFVLIAAVTFSCRTEEMELIEAPTDETIQPNSSVANLMKRTASNDGSVDNIIDYANCFTVQLPVDVTVNGIQLTINDSNDYNTIENIFDELDDDDDTIVISYPITIILADFTEVTITNDAELMSFANNCNGENEQDDDIECLDFVYPISASVFNINNELIDTVYFNDDSDLYDFLDGIESSDIVSLNFPITVVLYDNSQIIVNSQTELESTINSFSDSCDEDDDYDYNDDDCDSCSTSDLDALFTDCMIWTVDKLERNDIDLEDNYQDYLFSFNTDGSIVVTQNTNTFNGTWVASGISNNIEFNINIPGLNDFNATWFLHEIEEEPGEVKFDLRLGEDRLRFESDCNNTGGFDDTELVNALTTGEWYITYFFDDTDETIDFIDYVFNFDSNNTATATDTNGTNNGNWSTAAGDETDLALILNFGTSIPLDELADDWDVLEVTNDIIRLKDVSGGNGSEDFLTFERTPFDGGNGNDDLTTILSDGLWIVASYFEDSDNQTADYNGYEINFDMSGSVVASNGSNTNSGTWMVLNGGNQMAIDFGSDAPFNEFNDDDWDVISSSNTEVVIQDVSGGNGGIDILTLQKI